MHSEWLEVTEEVSVSGSAVSGTQRRSGGRGDDGRAFSGNSRLAGGTRVFSGDSDIFLYPGQPFNVVDAMVTNFHLPESTLIMLVAAFAGYENTMAAYQQAVEQRYRFFSYGDAMFVTANPASRSEVKASNEDG